MRIKTRLSRIFVGEGILRKIKEEVERLKPFKVGIVTNERIANLWLDKLQEFVSFDNVFKIKEGERFKNLNTVIKLWKELVNLRFTRKSLLIGFGGGMINDVTGFVASTFMRGIMLAQIPTTLLSQVDASIGGKSGINFYGKNVIGTFYNPHFILIDTNFLTTLPLREIRSGMAEVVKCGIVWDRELFNYIEKNVKKIKDKTFLKKIIIESIKVKSQIVEKDEKEFGLRRILNFGHTLGHVIEKFSNYKIPHGFATSIGMVLESKIAEKMLGLKEVERIEKLLRSLNLPTSINLNHLKEGLLALDKKAWYGNPVFILPEKIGKVRIIEISYEEAIKFLR